MTPSRDTNAAVRRCTSRSPALPSAMACPRGEGLKVMTTIETAQLAIGIINLMLLVMIWRKI
ncbi:hypothetical protein ACT6QH_01890 [Xanthobacter sp. TB0139]|uniref:hypothetical protein n=1 Tax=Xanthobacter sp. TB0139 TaxID=3459178 RepID=UPI00403931F0